MQVNAADETQEGEGNSIGGRDCGDTKSEQMDQVCIILETDGQRGLIR